MVSAFRRAGHGVLPVSWPLGEPGSLVGAFARRPSIALCRPSSPSRCFSSRWRSRWPRRGCSPRRLDRLGVRFGFPEALIGLLTALAADGPEISSALFALIKGAHDVGVGVLVGSNGFNLAAMIGLSALLAGRVRLPREMLAARGRWSACWSRVVAGALLLGWLSRGRRDRPLGAGPDPLPDARDRRLAATRALPTVALVSRPLARALHEHPAPSDRPTASSRPDASPAGADRRRRGADRRRQRGHGRDRAHPRPATGTSRARSSGVLILGPLTSIPNAPPRSASGWPAVARRWSARRSTATRSTWASGWSSPRCSSRWPRSRRWASSSSPGCSSPTSSTLAVLARPGGMRRAGAVVLIVLYLAFVVGTLVGS